MTQAMFSTRTSHTLVLNKPVHTKVIPNECAHASGRSPQIFSLSLTFLCWAVINTFGRIPPCKSCQEPKHLQLAIQSQYTTYQSEQTHEDCYLCAAFIQHSNTVINQVRKSRAHCGKPSLKYFNNPVLELQSYDQPC